MQPDGTPSGRYAFVTGASAGSSANTDDLDGQTTIESVPIALPATPGALSFSYVWSHGPSSAADFFRLYVEDEGGTKHLVWHVDGTASTVGASWHQARVSLADYGGQKVRLMFRATDGGHDTLVEALVDDIRVERPS
jgi:hypothetical protein